MEGGHRSAAASALVQSTLLGELLENAEVGALAIDEGHYVAANEYACQVLGYAREDLIGRRVGEPHPFASLSHRIGDEVAVERKDGTPLRVRHCVVRSRLGAMPITVALFWPV